MLINPTDSPLTGIVVVTPTSPVVTPPHAPPGAPLSYTIAPRSFYRFSVAFASDSPITTGFMRVIPDVDSPAPASFGIFSLHSGGILLTAANIAAAPDSTAFRLYAEASTSVRTGIAVANTSSSTARLTLELTNCDGSATGLTGTLSVPPNSHAIAFLNEIPGFASLPTEFNGTLRLTSSALVSLVGLRGRYNERGDFLMTAVPAVDELTTPTERLFVPQIVDSGGYTTQFVLFNGQPVSSSAGSIELFSQTGDPLNIPLQ